jgi:hypothetical protein
MSNLEVTPEFDLSIQEVTESILLEPRSVKLTPRSGITIERTLPHRELRTIGAWCFVDHFGPTSQVNAMSVAAHPHTGLQTVTWLFSGLVEHRDSIGSTQEIQPGQLNLMTAGHGISHSELSIKQNVPLHGIQLWIVLPDSDRDMKPEFEHHSDLPILSTDLVTAKVFVGEFNGVSAITKTYSPLVGVEIYFDQSGEQNFELISEFEYGLLAVFGEIVVQGKQVPQGSMLYLKPGDVNLSLASTALSRAVLIGGQPFTEPIIMWWNFIGRSHQEILQMRTDWEDEADRFGSFNDRIGGRIPAPQMPNLKLTPRNGKPKLG